MWHIDKTKAWYVFHLYLSRLLEHQFSRTPEHFSYIIKHLQKHCISLHGYHNLQNFSVTSFSLKKGLYSANFSRANDTFPRWMLSFQSPFEQNEIWIICKVTWSDIKIINFLIVTKSAESSNLLWFEKWRTICPWLYLFLLFYLIPQQIPKIFLWQLVIIVIVVIIINLWGWIWSPPHLYISRRTYLISI